METSVLVAYATKHGATAGIAEKIGEVLRESGLACDVKLAAAVDDLTPYQAVVLGSAVYMGAWRKEAASVVSPATISTCGSSAHARLSSLRGSRARHRTR